MCRSSTCPLELGPSDARVRVDATTVNRTDCGVRAAKPFFIRVLTGLVRPRAIILGTECAGVVESVGPRMTRFSAADRVFGNSPRFGAHAELVSIPEDGPVAAIPGGLSFEDVAPSTEGAHHAPSITRRPALAAARMCSSMARQARSAVPLSNCSQTSVRG